jgi:hypothetical protein
MIKATERLQLISLNYIYMLYLYIKYILFNILCNFPLKLQVAF